MTTKFRYLYLVGALAALPAFAVHAQGTGGTASAGSNRSSTATPGTADNKAESGFYTGDASKTPLTPSAAAMNPNTPGGTGETVVRGDHSSITNDASNTLTNKSRDSNAR